MKLNGNQNLTEQVMRHIETSLLDGSWVPGMRIPSERDLADRFSVSRPTVRAAVQRLVARGLLRSRPAAGVYVTDRLQAGWMSPWRQLLADHPELRSDVLEFRRMLEGTTAYLAALRASESDLDRLGTIFGRLCEAHASNDAATEAKLDAEFHEAIAGASQNAMFRHLQGSVMKILREHITLGNIGISSQRSAASAQLFDQHRRIWDAIRLQQPEMARDAMLAHIEFVWTQLEPDVPVTPGP
jgi:GntR family transcriptional regulator, transcriptional repressor for pyruvate dehydrogenase complex